jgi:hypothetical protein
MKTTFDITADITDKTKKESLRYGVTEHLNKIMQKAWVLNNEAEKLVSFLNANGVELNDSVFDVIDMVKDGDDVTEELVDRLLGLDEKGDE